MSVGVIVGRFQLRDLHMGHQMLLRELALHGTQIIFVGISRKDADSTDPLPFQAVQCSIAAAAAKIVGSSPVSILPLLDHPSNEEWSKELDRQVQLVSEESLDNAVLIHGRDSFISSYTGGIKTIKSIDPKQTYSATKDREHVKITPVYTEELWRRGVIWARMNERPKCLPTVDIAIFTPKGLIFIRKKDEDKWRLPGGFVEPGETLEHAAKREAIEECGDIEIGDLQIQKSFVIDDWRMRKSPHKITSTLLTANYVFGNPKAGDDAAWIKCAPVQFIELDWIVPEHHDMMRYLLRLGKICLPTWQALEVK